MGRYPVFVEKKQTLTGHRDAIYTLEPAADPAKFYTAGGDGLVVEWSFSGSSDGQLIARVHNSVYALHLVAGQNRLLVGHNYDGLHEIDLESRTEIRSLNITQAAIFDIKKSGELVFVATGEGELVVVHYDSWQVVTRIKMGNENIRCLAVNTETNDLAIGASDHLLRILKIRDLKMRQRIQSHTNSVFTVCYSPDQSTLISAGRDAHMNVWKVGEDYKQLESIVAHMYTINHVAYRPNGKHFVTCSMDKSIKVWDAHAFKLLKVIDKSRHAGHGTSVNKLYWSAYHDMIASVSDDRTISLWNIEIGQR